MAVRRGKRRKFWMNLYPGKLPVEVRFGYKSPPGDSDLYPSVHTKKAPVSARVFFPQEPYYLSSMIHEGVHLIGWAEENLSQEEMFALVPHGDMAWDLGTKALLEEARCRLMDRWTLRLFDEIRQERVPYSLERRFDKPFVPALDDPKFKPRSSAGRGKA